MGHGPNHKSVKIIRDRERITPGSTGVFSGRLFREHTDRYRFARRYVTGKRVADMACGTGYGSSIMMESKPLRITAVDIDKGAITYARKHYGNRNITFIRRNLEKEAVRPGSTDVIVSFETIEHLRQPNAFLSHAWRALKKSGMLVISTPNRDCSIEDNPYHFTEYRPGEFRKLLSSHFKGRIAFYGQRPVNSFIIALYKRASRLFPVFLKPLLRIRPWEPLRIEKIRKGCYNYLYIIAVCRK